MEATGKAINVRCPSLVGRPAFWVFLSLALGVFSFPHDAEAKRVDFRGSIGSINIKHKLNASAKGSRKLNHFRWRVVNAPESSDAKLFGPRRAYPRLLVDRAGYYLLQVRARSRGGRKTNRLYRIAARPPVGPLGLSLETISDRDGQTRVGNDYYGRVSPASSLRLVLVDRNTLEVSAGEYPGTRESFVSLGRRIADADSSKLVIIVAIAPLEVKNQADVDAFNDNIANPIGARSLDRGELTGPERGQSLSIVGVPGWTQGAAALNLLGQQWFHSGEPPSSSGSISGYIQKDGTGAFGLAFKDFLDFDTRLASSGPHENVMKVGDFVLRASLPEGQSGFHIVKVSPGGFPYDNGRAIATTNTGGRPTDIAGTRAATEWIQDSGMVLIQSIGTPQATSGAWDALSHAVEDLGGVRSILNSLNRSSGGYAFIGGTRRPDLAVESVNDAASGQTGTLSGLLARAPTGDLRPTISDPTGEETGAELPQLAYSAPTAWPYRVNPGHQAALAYFSEQLRLNTSDPRLRYTDLSLRFNGDLYVDLKATSFVEGRGFTSEEFDDVKTQLLNEFRWVGNTVAYFDETRKVLTESVILRQGELDKIANTILSRLPSPDAEVPFNFLSLFGTVFGFARGEVPGAGIISSAFTVAANKTRGERGMPSIDRLKVAAGQLSRELVERYGLGLDTLGLIRSLLLTDPTKLETVGTHIANSDPGWIWTDAIEAKTRNAMVVAARKSFYGSLLGTSFQTYILPDYDRFPTASSCRVLGDDQPAESWFVSREGFAASDFPMVDLRVRAIGLNREDDRYGRMKADGVLTAPLFRPIPEGLGFYRPAFMARNLDVSFIPRVNCESR